MRKEEGQLSPVTQLLKARVCKEWVWLQVWPPGEMAMAPEARDMPFTVLQQVLLLWPLAPFLLPPQVPGICVDSRWVWHCCGWKFWAAELGLWPHLWVRLFYIPAPKGPSLTWRLALRCTATYNGIQ